MTNLQKTDSNKSPSRRRYHHGDLRRAIEETTLSIIETDGLDSVSLRAVARRLGVSEAAPYHHFSGKSELLAVLAAKAYLGLHKRMLDAADEASDDPYARMSAAGKAYVLYGLESRGRFRIMFGEHMEELAAHEEVYAASHPVRLMLRQLITDCIGQNSGDVLTVESSVWSLVHGLTWLMLEREILTEHDPNEVETTVADALGLLIRGIKASQGQ